MQLEKILVLLSIAAYGAAENDVEASDVPSECLPACQFTIDLSARCDRETDDDDTYTPCVCNAQDSMQRLTECASCVKDHGRSDPDDNDVADLMDDCGWDFNDADGPYPTSASTTTTVSNPSSTSSGVATVTVTQSSTSGSETPSVSSVPSSSATTETPSTTETSSQTSSATGGSTTTVLVDPSTTETAVPDNMAGSLSAKAVVGPLVAGLIVGFPLLL